MASVAAEKLLNKSSNASMFLGERVDGEEDVNGLEAASEVWATAPLGESPRANFIDPIKASISSVAEGVEVLVSEAIV